jgi:hypothetical protein
MAASVGWVCDRRRGNRRNIFRRRRGNRGAVNFHQRFAFGDVGSDRHVGDLLDKAFGPHGDDGNTPFIERDGAGCTNDRAHHAFGCRLRLNAGALDLPRRNLDRPIVAIVAFKDGDIVHPHRILLRHRRGVGQAHRIAVESDFAIRGCWRRVRRCLFIEIDVGAGADGAIVATIRGLLRRRRVGRPAIRVLIINDIAVAALRCGRRDRFDVSDVSRSQTMMANEIAANRRCQNGNGAGSCHDRFHLSAWMTSLFSTVPVSPCTLAPSDSCQ